MAIKLSLSDQTAIYLYDILKHHIEELETRAKNKMDDFDGRAIYVYGMMTGKAQTLCAILEDSGLDTSLSSWEKRNEASDN